jgi:hypothetical protein
VSLFITDYESKETLFVCSSTDYWYPENITPEMARMSIERSKVILKELNEQSVEFAQCVQKLPRLYLCYTGGDEKGDGQPIAEEKEGVFGWWL